MKKKNKEYNYEELKSSIMSGEKSFIAHKDRLFKLSRLKGDIEAITFLATEFKMKSAIQYLKEIEKNNIEKVFCSFEIDLIEQALNDGMDINTRNSNSYSLLHTAAELDNIEAIEYLVGKSIDINSQLKDGATPLLLAAQKNNYRSIKALISAGANVDTPSVHNYTPLLAAVSGGNNLEAANHLITNGAEVNIQGDDGFSPLLLCALNNYTGIAELLIRNNANPNLVTLEGYNALHCACIKDKENIVKILLDLDINVNHQDKDGDTPLIIAARNGSKNIIELLLKSNQIDLNIQNIQGDSALMLAAYFNYLGIVKLLVEGGADLDLTSNEGHYALDFSFMKNNRDVSNYLIEANSKTSLNSKVLSESLIKQCFRGETSFVKLGIRNGANINFKGENGNTPIMIACANNHLDIIELLIDAGADINLQNDMGATPLWNAVYRGFENVVRILLNAGANPNAQDIDGNTPLLWIANSRADSKDSIPSKMKKFEKNDVSIRITRALLQNGSDPNIANNNSVVALNMCSRIGDIEMIEMLLDNNARLDTQDQFGITALMSAAAENHIETCRLLIKYGADVNVFSITQNSTALTAAIENNNIDIVKLLVEAGAEIKHVSISTTTKNPLYVHPNDMLMGNAKELADSHGHKEIEKYLDEHMRSEEALLRKELEEKEDSIKRNPEVNESFTLEEMEEIFTQIDDQGNKIQNLKKTNEELNDDILEYERITEKFARNLGTRYKLLYKTLQITERTLKQIVKLDEKELMKLEQQFGLLHHSPDKVKHRCKINGTEINEIGFNRSGRIYIKKNAKGYEVVCVGDKGTQSKDIKFMKSNYSSRKNVN